MCINFVITNATSLYDLKGVTIAVIKRALIAEKERRREYVTSSHCVCDQSCVIRTRSVRKRPARFVAVQGEGGKRKEEHAVTKPGPSPSTAPHVT